MEIKPRKSSTDDRLLIESESEKQQRKKRKVTEDYVALKVGKKMMIKSRNSNTSSHLPLKIMYSEIMYSGKEESKKQRESTKESESETNFVDGTNISEKFLHGKKIESGLIGVIRPMNTKNSHLPLKVMCSVKEEKSKEIERMEEIESNGVDGTNMKSLKYSIKYSVIEEKRREIERKREILKVRSREEKMIKKAEDEERMAFWARVRGHEQRPAEFLGDPRGLQSTSTVAADVKNLLQGKTHNELELLQSQVQLQMCFSSFNDVEYWQTVLQLIHIYKVKACLDIHAKIFGKFYGQEEGTGVAGGHWGEETGDNFEMKIMGIVEDGDALSGNNDDEVICQSQVCWSQNKCQPRKPNYFDPVHNGYGWNNYNQTY